MQVSVDSSLTPLRAGKQATLTFSFSRDGKPVEDLQRLENAVRPRGVIGARHHRAAAGFLDTGGNHLSQLQHFRSNARDCLAVLGITLL